jgi:ATP-dependent DNA ligase
MITPFLPMLAARAEPFDSPEFLFEVKWNGVRALAASADGRWQLWGRDLADYTYRYPELDMLTGLPSGTVLDGELVLLRDGLPDLEAMLARHQLGCPTKIRQRSQAEPVTYVLFDALCHQGRSYWPNRSTADVRYCNNCWSSFRNRDWCFPRASSALARPSSSKQSRKVKKASWPSI